VFNLVLNSPRGTFDIYGNEIKYRDFIINTVRDLFDIFNFEEIITPAFEYTEVFSKSIGVSTDIVQKEMYTFPDRKGRSLTLRPEGTASVVRSAVEKKMLSSGSLPVRLFYIGNMFRYERPQKGRTREFWQIGVESLGSGEPMLDAEIMWLLDEIFFKLGFKNLELNINCIGCTSCKESFTSRFKKYIGPFAGDLCTDCKRRLKENPLRIFDCKVSQCLEKASGGPKITSFLCTECEDHFEKVKFFLKSLSIKYKISDELVRGFDYYTGTIFEMTSKELESAQNALGGGGRYNKLLKEFGGPDMPAIGFAIGLDRTIMLMKELRIEYKQKKGRIKVYFISTKRPDDLYSLKILKILRDAGISCETNYGTKNIGNGVKKAGKKGFKLAAIIGSEEIKTRTVSVKDLNKFKQYNFNQAQLVKKIMELTGAK